jgi:hypothetical protein
MSEFFEYDSATGIRTDTEFNAESGEMSLIRTADVEPVLEYAKALANHDEVSRRGIKESWWLYAKIPPIVMLQLRAKGIDVFDKNDEKRVFAELNTNYAYLKTTSGNHGGKTRILV